MRDVDWTSAPPLIHLHWTGNDFTRARVEIIELTKFANIYLRGALAARRPRGSHVQPSALSCHAFVARLGNRRLGRQLQFPLQCALAKAPPGNSTQVTVLSLLPTCVYDSTYIWLEPRSAQPFAPHASQPQSPITCSGILSVSI